MNERDGAAGWGIRGHGSQPGHTSTASRARARASAAPWLRGTGRPGLVRRERTKYPERAGLPAPATVRTRPDRSALSGYDAGISVDESPSRHETSQRVMFLMR